MIEVPKRQTCACGEGCHERSAVKWNGYLVVTCVPDEEAMFVVEAIMEGARRSMVEERAAVVAWIKRDALQEDRIYPQMVLMGWIAQEIERGEHRREGEP
jgi:phage head maturation protease